MSPYAPSYLAAVALGGAIGSVCRYALGIAVHERFAAAQHLPLATLAINASGSLLLGFLLHAMLESGGVAPAMRLLLTTGFCGGFTTFSTFSVETVRLVEAGEGKLAASYVGASLLLSIAGALLGIWLARVAVGLKGQ